MEIDKDFEEKLKLIRLAEPEDSINFYDYKNIHICEIEGNDIIYSDDEKDA